MDTLNYLMNDHSFHTISLFIVNNNDTVIYNEIGVCALCSFWHRAPWNFLVCLWGSFWKPQGWAHAGRADPVSRSLGLSAPPPDLQELGRGWSWISHQWSVIYSVVPTECSLHKNPEGWGSGGSGASVRWAREMLHSGGQERARTPPTLPCMASASLPYDCFWVIFPCNRPIIW